MDAPYIYIYIYDISRLRVNLYSCILSVTFIIVPETLLILDHACI
jgi:hypothetical protein